MTYDYIGDEEIMTEESTTIEGLTKAIQHVDKVGAEAQAKLNQFNQNFQELTGYKPNQPITALDVYKIISKVVQVD